MKVLVTGGTGVVGKASVDRLLAAGHRVRLLSRHAEDDARQWPEGVEPHTGDVTSDDGVRGAAEGCDAVLHVVGIVAESPPAVTFQAVNVDGTRRMAREAKRAGVRRFVYVSSLGANGGESDYHRSKFAGEAAVREEDPPGWLIVRPGNVYGPGDEVISTLLKMVRTMPAIPLVGMGDQPFQPVWHQDLGEALARAVINPEPVHQALDLAGPEVTSTREILERLEALTDMHPVHLPVPELLTKLGARAAETVGIELPIKEDQVTMLIEGNLIPPGQPNALTDVFGVEPLGLDAGLRKLVDALPEAIPSDGTGKLERQSYWADIRGSRMSPDEIFDMLRREFYTLPPEGLVKVGVEPGSPLILDEGETLTLSLPMRGHIQVRVAEARNRVITLLTVEGHPLSGAIRFMVEEREGGIIRFEIRSFTRASNLLDLVGMRTAGFLAQKANWRAVVARVVERSGGEAVDGVNDETGFLGEEDARGVEKWVDELVVGLRRAEAPSLGEDT
jgi:NADH dehydrogenase